MASLSWLFPLILSSAFVQCAANIFPRNTAVVAGQRMEMKCRNDAQYSFRSWQMHRVSDELERIIFQYNVQGSYFPQFGIERGSPESVTLFSNSTASSDAGVYRCTSYDSSSSDLVTYSAQLIVFESHPECISDLKSGLIETGTSISIRCNVRFKGHVAPEIEWRQSEYGGSNGGQLVTHDVTNLNGHIISTLNIVVDFSQPRIFTFKTFFSTPSSSSDDNAASNAPDYTYTWKSLPIGPPSAFSQSTSIAPSSMAVKPSRQDGKDEGEGRASYYRLYASTTSAGANGEPKFSFVFEHWILISVCVGVAVLVSVIVAALVSYSRCVRAKKQAAVKQGNGITMQEFGTYVEMQRSADTYCSIGDDLVYNNENANASPPPQQILAKRSLSSPGNTRNLPRPPLALSVGNPSYDIHVDRPSQKQRTNTLSHGNTRQNSRCGSGLTLALPLSTSLPTIYQDDSVEPITLIRVPVENGRPDTEASSYLAAQDVVVDEDSDTIPSTYLRVNKLSERN